ncbi:MAG: hypothetical protein LC099_11660 [Anaerolineales bacterium]|nr:hypothetical protein [Anaerolineales bacterium]
MQRFKLLLALFALIFSSFACNAFLDDEDFTETEPSVSEQSAPIDESEADNSSQPPTAESEIEISSEPYACSNVAAQIVATNSDENGEDESENAEAEATTIVYYTVKGDEIKNPVYEKVPDELKEVQKDAELHLNIWNYFVALIPLEQRPMLKEFSVFTDGKNNTLASVVQTDDPKDWRLEVDSADVDNYYYLSFTLVHEFAHLLTLNSNQVTPSLAVFNNPDDNDIYLKAISACDTFFPGEGCSNSDSYINAFYDQFWADTYEEWNAINLEEDPNVREEKLGDFYLKYEDQFLSYYSTTHPVEDIAEAFSYFVFSPKPSGETIAEQKILFFYQYPELIQLREEILSNMCENFPQE